VTPLPGAFPAEGLRAARRFLERKNSSRPSSRLAVDRPAKNRILDNREIGYDLLMPSLTNMGDDRSRAQASATN
jgi:hypothetical protein